MASSDVTADKFMVFRHNVTLFFKKPAVKTVAIVLAVLLVLLVIFRLTVSAAVAVTAAMPAVTAEATGAADTADQISLHLKKRTPRLS